MGAGTHTNQDAATFGAWVKQRRQALGWSQAELAQRVACSTETIRKIEGAKRRPSPQIAELLARHLKITADDFGVFMQLARPEMRPELLTPMARVQLRFNRRTIAVREGALPQPLTTLIGRAQNVEDLGRLLRRSDVRLVTITGPGGVGKTRLSIQVAATLQPEFADGVCFVSLAALTDPHAVLPTIAQKLGRPKNLTQSAGLRSTCEPPVLEALIDELSDRRLLLVLDNFEQVLPAAKHVAQLLSATPHLKIVITSRAALHLSGEHEYAVPPLPLPTPDQLTSPAALGQSPAVNLFIERARAVKADFDLAPHNAAAIGRICTQVGGLPLALELAAAHVKLLTPQALLTHLIAAPPGVPLDLLAGESPDQPVRHQSIRRTIEWSYHLLSDREQLLFRRLGVFAGSCSLDALTAICEAPVIARGNDVPPPESSVAAMTTLTTLAALIDQSLVFRADDQSIEPRYALLNLVREYALERLAASGETAVLQRRHAAYFAQLCESAQAVFQRPERAAWLVQLDADLDNLRTALAWCCSPAGDTALGLRFVRALWQYWMDRGHLQEGRAWTARIISRPDAAHFKPQLAQVLNDAGLLAWTQADAEAATQLFTASLALFTELGDSIGSAVVLNHLGQTARLQGRYQAAIDYSTQSLDLFAAAGLAWDARTAWVYRNLGEAAYVQGDYAQARAHHQRSLAIFQDTQEAWGSAREFYQLGLLARVTGDDDLAQQQLTQAVSLFKALEGADGGAWSLFHLSRLAQRQGETSRAVALLLESVLLFQHMADDYGTAWCLAGLAQAAPAGDRDMAVNCWARSAHAALQARRSQWTPLEHADYHDLLAHLDLAASSSETYTLAQAIDSALRYFAA